MGYTVEMEADDLRCKSLEDAHMAADLIKADDWIYPYHLQVEAMTWLRSGHDPTPCLEVTHFQGDHWHDENARKVWLAIAPYMADGSTIEFEGEGSERWRIRWEGGRVFEEYVTQVIWAVNEEITPEGGSL